MQLTFDEALVRVRAEQTVPAKRAHEVVELLEVRGDVGHLSSKHFQDRLARGAVVDLPLFLRLLGVTGGLWWWGGQLAADAWGQLDRQ